MLFFKRGKLKREFDEQLINQYIDTKQEWKKAQMLETLSDDYDLSVSIERKIAESKHLFLLKEARIRKVKMH
ncbi:YaaL family protein [Planococcus sp. N028]|uniref:YaaL family protein n=1 Tax=Planococcus shixiaomingii TaxID=3058393 RepID=A0ABT8N7J0_9BACL|nr:MULTISPECIES: YaaL family protein [unclassified Planococcus (in: firmicutes)]MDN7243854.1 YaaL family protein [Planococcus sp. N028]WKA54848.1 YaaL family protein [Planococcus sp. N022]